MPELKPEDVAGYSAVKVREEMKTRHEWLAGKSTETEGKLTSLEGDDGVKAAAYFRELNVLGIKADELAPIEDGAAKLDGIGSWLNDPAAPIFQPGKSEPQWKDAVDLIMDSAGYKRAVETGDQNFSVELPWDSMFGVKGSKVLGLDSTQVGVTAQFGQQAIRLPGVSVPVLFQGNNIAPTFLQGTTQQNAVPFMRETVTSAGAALVAEGAVKPEADITFTEDTAPVATIAVTLPVTNQLLEDEGFMRAWVEGRLRLFIQNAEDSALINGVGDLEGILTVLGTNAGGFGLGAHAADGTVGIDALYTDGIVPILEAFLDPSSIGMAAATWALFQLAKDANNNYLLGGPGELSTPRVWGIPVTVNQRFPAAVAAAEAIAVWSREAAMVVRRNQVSLAVTDSHASEFTSNVLRFRAEERLAFPVFRPEGISVLTTAI